MGEQEPERQKETFAYLDYGRAVPFWLEPGLVASSGTPQ